MDINTRIDQIKADLDIRKAMHAEMEKVLNDKQANLMPGKYKLIYAANKKLAYINNKKVKEHVKKLATPSYYKSDTRQFIVNHVKRTIDNLIIKDIDLSHDDHSTVFQGELVMLTREADIKIFDFEKNLVKTFFTACEYEKRKENYQVFKDHFNSTIINLDDLELSITEKLIAFKPYKDWEREEREKLFKIVFDNYLNFGKSFSKDKRRQKSGREIMLRYKTKIGQDELIQLIENYLNIYNLDRSFPMIKAHGDFTTNNILLNEDTYYFIDWEDSFEYVFFYDICNLIFVDYLHTGDRELLDYYLTGQLDDKLSELFDFYGIKYDPDKKVAYLLIFICERITKFEYNKNPKNLHQKINRYIEIVDDMTLN